MFSRGKSKEKNPRGRTKHGFEYIRRGITGIGTDSLEHGTEPSVPVRCKESRE
jgi:hypothetical protein